jgi:Family of unknown function (DUF6084)
VSELSFSVLEAYPLPYALSPSLGLKLRVAETTGVRVHTIALRAQVQIEPQKRRYTGAETDALVDLFGTLDRYGDTLKPMLWTHVSTMVLGFTGEKEFELQIPCSYDFEVAAHKYLTALKDGEIPIILLFSGTLYSEGERGIAAELMSWSCEARYRLPVAVWRATMDAHFPNSAWIRIDRDVFAELDRFRVSESIPTWDATISRLCDIAAEKSQR